jgi:alkylhydroperoxidase family enzyme
LTSFAKRVVRQRGLVSDSELEIARTAGIDDGLMLEVVANVALHTLTNYANRLADTEIDSPVVEVSLQDRK